MEGTESKLQTRKNNTKQKWRRPFITIWQRGMSTKAPPLIFLFFVVFIVAFLSQNWNWIFSDVRLLAMTWKLELANGSRKVSTIRRSWYSHRRLARSKWLKIIRWRDRESSTALCRFGPQCWFKNEAFDWWTLWISCLFDWFILQTSALNFYSFFHSPSCN